MLYLLYRFSKIINVQYVCDVLKQVIISVSTAGERIIAVISDNNVVNYNNFNKLAFKKCIANFKYILINQ